jgi:hypothetical protein
VSLQVEKEELEKQNEEIIHKRKIEWREARKFFEVQYEEDLERAHMLHTIQCQTLEAQNQEFIAAKLLAHKAKVAAIETFNETISSVVEASNLVEDEIHRIETFLQYVIDHSSLPIQPLGERKRSLDRSLNMLIVSDKPCQPNVIIDALQEAFKPMTRDTSHLGAGKSNARKVSRKTKPKSRFEGMVPIHPERVCGHDCVVKQSKEDRLL